MPRRSRCPPRPPFHRARLAEGLAELRARRLQRGHEPEEHTRQQRHDRRHQQHGAVEPTLSIRGRSAGASARRTRRHSERDRNPGDAAEHRQQHAFREQLPNEPPPARAQRHAHRDLALAHGGAREQQVGDVRARDEEHRGHGAEHDPERRTERRADDLLGEWSHGHAVVAVRGVLLLETFRDRAEVRACALE